MQKIILFILFVVFQTSLFCQIEENEKEIKVIAEVAGDTIKIRWVPSDYDVWQKGIEFGYNIERVIIEPNLNLYPSIDSIQSFQALFTGLKPLGESEWQSVFTSNVGIAARKILYDSSEDFAPSNLNSLKDVIDYKEQEDSKFLFAMITAEIDFNVAKGLALAFEDVNINPGEIYKYQIYINDTIAMQEIVVGEVILSSDFIASDFPDIATSGFTDLKNSFVQWDITEASNFFTSWSIERSIDSVNFQVINDKPYFFTQTDDEIGETALYKDEVPNSEIPYYYRVRGISPFGSFGPYSSIIKLKCEEKPLSLDLKVSDFGFIGDHVAIYWDELPSIYSDSLLGFNVYRFLEPKGLKEKLNSQILDSSAREFLDNSSLRASYYAIEAIDLLERPYYSSPMFVQKEDSIPPLIPTGIIGEFVNEQVVTLSWEANQEEDIDGYLVYTANFEDGHYIYATTKIQQNPTYKYELTEGIKTDSIYFRIIAVDKTGNRSEKSDFIGLKRPDVFPPSAPFLSFVNPTPEGVAVSWKYSGEEGVEHRIQRKIKNQYEWLDLLIINESNKANFMPSDTQSVTGDVANYIDNHELQKQYYSYRIIAKDEAGNTSFSDLMDAFPFAANKSSKIEDLTISSKNKKESFMPEATNDLQNLASQSKRMQSYTTAQITKTSIKLKWKFEIDPDLEGFNILRGITGGNIAPVDFISVSEALGLEAGANVEISGTQKRVCRFLDSDVIRGKRYSYKIVAKYKNGEESEESKLVNKKI